jgi:hypothetical protein
VSVAGPGGASLQCSASPQRRDETGARLASTPDEKRAASRAKLADPGASDRVGRARYRQHQRRELLVGVIHFLAVRGRTDGASLIAAGLKIISASRPPQSFMRPLWTPPWAKAGVDIINAAAAAADNRRLPGHVASPMSGQSFNSSATLPQATDLACVPMWGNPQRNADHSSDLISTIA